MIPFRLLDLRRRKTITIVGAFQSYIRKISESGNKLYVSGNERECPYFGIIRKFFVPACEFDKVIPSSDIVIITGQTLVNRTIDELLAAVSPGTEVIVTGPSSSLLPDILFENKVTMIGTSRIIRPEILFDVVSEGGTGYHLFEYCAKKICILKGDGHKLSEKWIKASIAGTIWAASEIVLGSFLHNLKFRSAAIF